MTPGRGRTWSPCGTARWHAPKPLRCPVLLPVTRISPTGARRYRQVLARDFRLLNAIGVCLSVCSPLAALTRKGRGGCGAISKAHSTGDHDWAQNVLCVQSARAALMQLDAAMYCWVCVSVQGAAL